METARQINESIKKTANSSMMIMFMPKKRPIIATTEKTKRAKGSNSKKMPCNKEMPNAFLVFHLFLVEQRKL